MKTYPFLDLEQIKVSSITKRKSLIQTADFVKIPQPRMRVDQFLQTLPDVLKAADFNQLINAIVKAVRTKRPVILLMGAHLIKCGLSPLIVDLIQSGVLCHVAMTGAGAIHDLEIACWGKTSEDVLENLKNGTFGMSKQTAYLFNSGSVYQPVQLAGLGQRLGNFLIQHAPPFRKLSILASGAKYQTPVTVHVGIGTDIVHQHPGFPAAEVGKVSWQDFKILARSVSSLNKGSVVLNFGSAVILPEVFLKAVAVARNITGRARGFIAANFDMIQQYRPNQNIVYRPTLTGGGKGYSFTGHHEIMLPLLVWAIKSKLRSI